MSEIRAQRGLVFSTDIIIGVTILFIVIFSGFYIFTIPKTYEERLYEQTNLIANDLLNSLSELKVYEAQDLSPTINQLITNQTLTEDEQETSVFNLILTLWAQGEDEGNQTKKDLAKNITRELITSIGNYSERINLSLVIGNSTIYGNYSSLSAEERLAVSTIVESTYSSEKTKYGYISRAYLSDIDKEDSSYLYFGGFVGQGNLSYTLKIPTDASITGAYIEVYAGANFDLYINGNLSGNFTPTTFENFTANLKSSNINISNLKPGNNTIEIKFTSGNITDFFIGGGFLRVTYTTSKFYEEREVGKIRYYFPGINGLINLYDGFYIPGDLNNMSAYLHYNNNITGTTIYLTIANSTIFRSNLTGEQIITLNNSQLYSNLTAAGLSYSNLSRNTIPIKLGTETLLVIGAYGASDAILITDVSGSMGTCDVESNTECDCDSPPPCNRTRINVAKEVDKDFVEGMLNTSGNRVGLVAYETGIYSYHELSDDNESLINEIDSYVQGGYTCICCGIKMAIEALKKPYLQVLIDNNSNWLYTTNYPTLEPPEIDGLNWTDVNYNDTNWSSGKAILGFENWKYRRLINISNTAGNLTNYQIKIELNLSDEYSNHKIQQYCQDARFTYYNSTSGTETEIPYWIETCNLLDLSNATFWVKVPFLENNTNTTIYLYYGNPSVTSTSNPTATFDFYDDFEEGILESTKWTKSVEDNAGVGTHTSKSGIYSMYTRWSNVEVTSTSIDLNDTTPISVSYWVRRGEDTFSEDPDLGEDLVVEYLDNTNTWIQLDFFAGSGTPGEIYDQIHYLPDSALHSGFRLRFTQTSGSGPDWDYWHVDDIIIRKYADPEPTINIGDEENTSKSLAGDIKTNIGNNGGNYYFRKHFNLDSLEINKIEYLYFYLLSDDRAEVYLNGNLIYNETQEHNASYWNVGSDLVFYDGFENGIDTNIWTRGGSVSPYWIIYNNPVIEGLNSSGNNDIVDNQESWIQTNISTTQDSILYYYWKVSSENNWDFLSFYLDDLVVSRIDGNIEWRLEKFYLPIGNYTIKWNYMKDGSVSSGSDTGWIDDIKILEKKYHLSKNYLRSGDNVIAVKLYNNDNESAKFDLKLEAKLSRVKAMVVMSDGEANRCCGYPNPGSCWDYERGKNDAIQAGCDARDQGIKVYSVAFGEGADEGTLKKIACWNCSANNWIPGEEGENCPRFYKSRDVDELKEIYRKIAQEIANLSLEKQVMVVGGNISWANNFLYNDSYLEFNYNETPPDYDFGEFSLTLEKNFTSPGKVSLIKPNETEIIEAKLSSYSSDYWTSLVTINNSEGNFVAYNLSIYGSYSKLGDPFIVSLPVNYIDNGTNNITLNVGLSENNRTLGSNDSKLIYKLKVPGYVGYGNTFNTSEEAEQDAVNRLINKIYNLVGINISSWNITKPTRSIKGVRAIYGPSLVKITVWEE